MELQKNITLSKKFMTIIGLLYTLLTMLITCADTLKFLQESLEICQVLS